MQTFGIFRGNSPSLRPSSLPARKNLAPPLMGFASDTYYSQLSFPEVDRNWPIRKEVNDWNNMKQPIITRRPLTQIMNNEVGINRLVLLTQCGIHGFWYWYNILPVLFLQHRFQAGYSNFGNSLVKTFSNYQVRYCTNQRFRWYWIFLVDSW